MNKQQMILLMLITLVAMAGLLGGCGASGDGTSSEKVTLAMGFVPNVQFTSFYMALDKDYFAEEGIELEFDYGSETDLLALVGLEDFEGVLPRALSGGMAQRVILARALVGQPEVLLLDEPFGSLDAMSREQMNLELLRIWRARQVTAVMVTHDLQEAIFVADRVLVMSPGPGRIRSEVIVNLPRPRTLEVMYTEFFGARSRQVRGVIGPTNKDNLKEEVRS